MNDTELKERYAQEPWGKLLIEMGMEPYDTESSARRVAEYTAERIAKIAAAIESIEDAAYSVQDWSGTHLGETLDEARKTAGLPFYG